MKNKPIIKKSNEIYSRAEKIIPAGTQTLSKGTSQFVNGFAPKYLEKGIFKVVKNLLGVLWQDKLGVKKSVSKS